MCRLLNVMDELLKSQGPELQQTDFLMDLRFPCFVVERGANPQETTPKWSHASKHQERPAQPVGRSAYNPKNP